MNKIVVLLLAATIVNGCSSSKVGTTNTRANTLSNKEKQEGFQLLFDGSTTNGWHTYGYNTAGNAWVVTDGAVGLNMATKSSWPRNESRDLLTNEEYENFHFIYDWKIGTKGNSGVIFLVNEDKVKYRTTYQTGLEMQVIDNNGHPDAKNIKHRAGDLYDLISSSSEPAKPANEWNHAEIILNKGKLDFYLNGVHIINTTMWDDNWKKLVAGSKFKSMPAFSTFKKGKIALQEHGEEVWFRNLKIKRL
ncbi:MAG: glycosyl hydrolase [Segetibacter sp.]|nr:glycosyl hydrolase [Segetibacter sp.]